MTMMNDNDDDTGDGLKGVRAGDDDDDYEWRMMSMTMMSDDGECECFDTCHTRMPKFHRPDAFTDTMRGCRW